MVRFIPARTLKPDYGVFGHFYTVEVSPQTVIECRSVLELVAQSDVPSELSRLSQRQPDAVIIMMNPGSSRPLVTVENRVSRTAIHKLPISLVPTWPDTTQYQVMRVMHYCGWRHVRVLNLSDLRCAQSTEFFQNFQRLEAESAFETHSVFARERTDELHAKLTRHTSIPVIRAWGVSPRLDPLIDRCTQRLARNRLIYGLPKPGTINKYLHPLPSLQSQKLRWVNRMVAQFRGLTALPDSSRKRD